MSPRNHQRVKRPRSAILLRPYLLQLEGLPDQNRLHHAGLVSVAGIEPFDPRQRRGAQVHHRFLKQIAATSRQDAHASGGRRRGPIDVLPCQEAPVIERARISEIARCDAPSRRVRYSARSAARAASRPAWCTASPAPARRGPVRARSVRARPTPPAAPPRTRPESPPRARWHRSVAAAPVRAPANRAPPRRTARAGSTLPPARAIRATVPGSRGRRIRQWPPKIQTVQTV